MVMTIVMEDAAAKLGHADQLLLQQLRISALLYADDTLLLSANTASVQRLLAAVKEAGAAFGLQLHSDKFQLLSIRS